MTVEREPLSVAIITLNEEERLPACLESLTFADEVVVVDSGSTDRTKEVAAARGARVFSEPWRGYSAQKQFAVDLCRHDWVLILDADERIPAETATAVKRALAESLAEVTAFGFKRKNFLHGRWIKHGGWWPDQIVRLVNRRRGRFDGQAVHERWITEGEIKLLDAPIEHLSFRNYSELVAKMENYSNLAARQLHQKGAQVSALTPASHGFWMFIRTYFLKLGILDGFDGFVIAVMNAGGSFLKYAKLREQTKAVTNDK